MEMSFASGLLGAFAPKAAIVDISGLVNLVFYQEINNFLRDEIAEFQQNLVGRMMVFFGIMAMAILTIWIILQGWRIVTGRSRESMMGLVMDSLRATLVVSLATGLAAANGPAYDALTEGMGSVIVSVVTNGEDTNDLYQDIDKSLALMNLALGSVEAIQVQKAQGGNDDEADATKTRNLYFAGFGTAGPAITAGVMLTLNKIAVALFVGLGPLFIMCLLFDQTKALFQRWLLYGIGTWFSLAVLYVMVILAMDLTLAVGGALWAGQMISNANGQGVNAMAIQQAGLGTILTMLLITAPGMAAAFFQGTLGQFMHYSAFDQNPRNMPSAQGPAGSVAPQLGNNQQAPRSASPQLTSQVPALASPVSNSVAADVTKESRREQ